MENRGMGRDQILSKVRHVIFQLEEDTEFEHFNSETNADITKMLFVGSYDKNSHLYKDSIFQKETLRLLLKSEMGPEYFVKINDLGKFHFEVEVSLF